MINTRINLESNKNISENLNVIEKMLSVNKDQVTYPSMVHCSITECVLSFLQGMAHSIAQIFALGLLNQITNRVWEFIRLPIVIILALYHLGQYLILKWNEKIQVILYLRTFNSKKGPRPDNEQSSLPTAMSPNCALSTLFLLGTRQRHCAHVKRPHQLGWL